jgi:ribosomal protein S18 acetylase RimI-like enzyme
MINLTNPIIKLKENLDKTDCETIKKLEQLCLEIDQTSLKLELDYKLEKAQEPNAKRGKINEFLCYDQGKLIGYSGICNFSGDEMEVNGMVHPDYRRSGVFKRLFALVRNEWSKRAAGKLLLLCDRQSASGKEFIKYTGANYDFSEYEMLFKNAPSLKLIPNNVILRTATNSDAKEIIRQSSIYLEGQQKEALFCLPEEEEKYGILIYMAEVDHKVVGKVQLEIRDGIGGIYGLGVLPEYRGQGYGKGLIASAVMKLQEKNAQAIKLQVATTNKRALNIYRLCGFAETSTMDYYHLKKMPKTSVSNQQAGAFFGR